MIAKLRIVIYEEGKEPQTVTCDLPPGSQIIVGRGDDVQLWLTDRNISRNHCRMFFDANSNSLFIEDLQSRNGTYVNATKIERKTTLKDNDDIRLASTSHFTVSFSFIKPPKSNVAPLPTAVASPSSFSSPAPSIQLMNLIGAEFKGYRVEQMIGKGDMAIVYRGIHIALNRPVAIKTLTPRLLPEETSLQRFKNVAKIAGQLSHPNVVQIYDSGEYTYTKTDNKGDTTTINIPFLVMEYVSGDTLEFILKKEKILPVQTAAKIVGHIASVLSYLNKKKIIHRDINPSNILIGPEDVPKLIGLGLSKSLDASASNTQVGLGRSICAAPEQWMDPSKVDHRADIYSLGAVFYHCVCGRSQYNSNSIQDCWKAIHKKIPPILPYELNKEIPRAISDIILKCLAYDLEERFQSADDLLEELKPYLVTRNKETFEKARRNFFAMFPTEQSIPGFEFQSIYRPAEELGGDFYDFFQLTENEFGVVIGDITGHGVEAAVVVGMVKTTLKTLAKQSKGPSETLFKLNEIIYPDLEATTYATISYGIINQKEKTMLFSRAGHTPLIIFNPTREKKIEIIEPDGLVVGMFAEYSCKEIVIQLQHGDCLIQYTDGVTEAMNPEQEEFGLQRLQDTILRAGKSGNIKDILLAIEQDVLDFTGAEEQQDDIALTCIKIT